MCEKIWSEAE